MIRSPVALRDAVPTDAHVLAALWVDALRRSDPAGHVQDLTGIIASAAENPHERLVVAEHDGVVAGAVFLRATTATPLNLDPIVQAVSPHVFPEFRGRGVGGALLEAAAAFADERGIGHVGSASLSASRDANRFMARLGLRPQAVLRVGSVAGLRGRLAAQRPVPGRARGRQIGAVLAARRSQRLRDAGGTEPLSEPSP